MGRLEGRVVVLTGGTAGIGKECVISFANQGAHVVFLGRRQEKGAEVVSFIEAQNVSGDAVFVQGDVTVEIDIQKLFDIAVNRFGGVDIVIANAGIGGGNSLIESETDENWDNVYDVNVKGVFMTCRAAVPAIEKNGGGYIFNISSVGSVKTRVTQGAYCSSKAAVDAFTRCFSEEVKSRNIKVYSINPSLCASEVTEDWARRESLDLNMIALEINPSGRLGHGSDIAEAIVQIIEGKTNYAVGANICVDGGGDTFPVSEYPARLEAAMAQRK